MNKLMSAAFIAATLMTMGLSVANACDCEKKAECHAKHEKACAGKTGDENKKCMDEQASTCSGKHKCGGDETGCSDKKMKSKTSEKKS